MLSVFHFSLSLNMPIAVFPLWPRTFSRRYCEVLNWFCGHYTGMTLWMGSKKVHYDSFIRFCLMNSYLLLDIVFLVCMSTLFLYQCYIDFGFELIPNFTLCYNAVNSHFVTLNTVKPFRSNVGGFLEASWHLSFLHFSQLPSFPFSATDF